MKSKTLTFCAALALAGALPVQANQAQETAFKTQFREIRAPELPGRVSSVVTAAKSSERETTAIDAVTAAISVNPASAHLVVGSIARTSPEVAAVSAGTAASLQPKLVVQITKAAVGAAPSQVEAVVAAVCKAQPGSFRAVGIAAANVAPKSSDAILRGVSSSVPALKSLIARSTVDLGGSKASLSVASVLQHTDTLLKAWAKSLNVTTDALLAGDVSSEMNTKLASLAAAAPKAGPVIGPPYTPGGGTPGEINTAQTFEAPPGGRNYSSP